MLSSTPWHLSDETHNKYTSKWKHAYNSDINDKHQHTHIHTLTNVHTYTHTPPDWVCHLSEVSVSCVLKPTLLSHDYAVTAAFFSAQSENENSYIHSSLHNFPLLLESTSSKCFPVSQSKDEREESYILGNNKEKKDKRRKHKREVVGGE